MQRLTPLLLVAATLGAPAAELQREKHVVDEHPVTVSNRDEIRVRARNDDDVKNRELWYTRRQDTWGPWQKHGLSFARGTDIVWAPTEGHWRIYLRIEEVSGLAMPEPSSPNDASSEFIIDRTPPAVAITFPQDGSELRGGETYTVTWEATDPHLHSTPITIRYARSGDDDLVTVAENIPNTGAYDWTTPQDMTATGTLQIIAADKALNVGAAAVQGLVIDAIAPSRNILGPGISAQRELDVTIRATDAGPSGLARVQLVYSTDDGATWTPGPGITEAPFERIAFAAPTDGAYQLALVATDEAGNANPAPSGKAGGTFALLVDTEQPNLSLRTPTGIKAVAAAAAGRSVYKPGDEVSVTWQIKDANPKADGVSVFFQSQEGARWEPLATGLAPTDVFTFPIPDIATTTARVRVVAVDVAGNQGEVVSEAPLAIDNQVESGSIDIDL